MFTDSLFIYYSIELHSKSFLMKKMVYHCFQNHYFHQYVLDLRQCQHYLSSLQGNVISVARE